jgi:hypothetical protein
MLGGFSWLAKIGMAIAGCILAVAILLQFKGPRLLKADLWTEEQLRSHLSRLDTSKAEDLFFAMELSLQHHRVQESFSRLLLQLHMAWSFLLVLSLVAEVLHRTRGKVPGTG